MCVWNHLKCVGIHPCTRVMAQREIPYTRHVRRVLNGYIRNRYNILSNDLYKKKVLCLCFVSFEIVKLQEGHLQMKLIPGKIQHSCCCPGERISSQVGGRLHLYVFSLSLSLSLFIFINDNVCISGSSVLQRDCVGLEPRRSKDWNVVEEYLKGSKVVLLIIGICIFMMEIKCQWFSGKIQRCHRWAPGSIPGWRIIHFAHLTFAHLTPPYPQKEGYDVCTTTPCFPGSPSQNNLVEKPSS